MFNQLQVEKERKENERLAKLKAAQAAAHEPSKSEVLFLANPISFASIFGGFDPAKTLSNAECVLVVPCNVLKG